MLEAVDLLRTEVQLLSNSSADAGPWLRAAFSVPAQSNESSVRQYHNGKDTYTRLVLNALQRLHQGLGGELTYTTGICSWAALFSQNNDGDPNFMAALTERYLSPR